MKTFNELDKNPPRIEAGAPFICLDEQAYNHLIHDARQSAFKSSTSMCEQVYHASRYESDVQATPESLAANKAVEMCQKAILTLAAKELAESKKG